MKDVVDVTRFISEMAAADRGAPASEQKKKDKKNGDGEAERKRKKTERRT